MPNDQTHPFRGVNALPFEERYDNFIGGQWVPPKSGKYFINTTPITGGEIGEIARSGPEDIEAALDAAHAAKDKWGATSPAERANIMLKIADRMERNLAWYDRFLKP